MRLRRRGGQRVIVIHFQQRGVQHRLAGALQGAVRTLLC